jgi:hypothetical protein
MPSTAFTKFETNLIIDVQRIISTHSEINHSGMGRRGLGHITRSGVLMLCAAWELFIEEVMVVGVTYFTEKLENPKDLPKPVQKELARCVKESKHELKPLELAGEGWKSLYINHANEVLTGLNTPKSTNIDPLFKRFLGLEEISSHWSEGADAINKFVKARGDIAHRGREAKYVTISNLRNYKTLVEKSAIETDNIMATYLKDETPGGTMPWRRRLS